MGLGTLVTRLKVGAPSTGEVGRYQRCLHLWASPRWISEVDPGSGLMGGAGWSPTFRHVDGVGVRDDGRYGGWGIFRCGSAVARGGAMTDGAPWVPPEFWETEEMREALESWHIGRVIAAYRRHRFHGQPLPQERVASWVNLTQAQLSRLELGPPVKNLDKLWLWARTLRVPEHLLWFRLPGSDLKPAGSPESSRLAEVPSDRPSNGAYVPGVGWVQSRWDLWRRPGEVPPAPLRLPDGSEIPATPPRPAVAELFLKALQQYVVADNLLGPRSVLAVASQQLAVVEQILAGCRSGSQEEMLGVAARFAEFVGWLHQDVGDLQTGLQWSNAALEFAREAGDYHLTAYIWMRKSNIGSDMSQSRLALSYARAALRDAGKLSPRTRAVALRQVAHGHALDGDLDACGRALDRALAYADQGDDGDEADIARYCTPSYVEMEAAHCWIELGRPERAVTVLQEGLARWNTDFRRDLGLGLARLAVAHAANENPDGALAVAEQSLAIANQTLSSRTLVQLGRVRQLLRACGAEERANQVGHMLGALR